MKRAGRPFILLELFLALALISLSLIPLASYPFKIYQNEMTLLIEMQLEEISEVAFRDLLLNLASYVDPESLEPYPELPEPSYTIALSKEYQWTYKAVWELECKSPGKEPSSKALLRAKLLFIPQTKTRGLIKLPQPEKTIFEYFIEKKPSHTEGEVNEDK